MKKSHDIVGVTINGGKTVGLIWPDGKPVLVSEIRKGDIVKFDPATGEVLDLRNVDAAQ